MFVSLSRNASTSYIIFLFYFKLMFRFCYLCLENKTKIIFFCSFYSGIGLFVAAPNYIDGYKWSWIALRCGDCCKSISLFSNLDYFWSVWPSQTQKCYMQNLNLNWTIVQYLLHVAMQWECWVSFIYRRLLHEEEIKIITMKEYIHVFVCCNMRK